MPTITMRYHGPPEDIPAIGGYILSDSARPKWGHLIMGVRNRGKRGGLGSPAHYALTIQTERVPVDEARQGPTWIISWGRRRKRR